MKLKTSCSLLFCVALLFTGCGHDKSSVPNDERIGDEIITVLEKYKAEQGLYPDTLTQLIPDYMGKITPPRYGQKRWDYIHYCKNDSFGLAMWGQDLTDDGFVYSSERRKWEVAENSF